MIGHPLEVGDHPLKPSEFVKLHIAPWALPNEDIPIHIRWESGLEFQTVRINIPEGFAFAEFVNLDEVQIEGLSATVEKSKISRGDASTYFGCVVRYTRIPDGATHEGKVIFSFADGAQSKFSSELTARIFRPVLTFVNPPKSIELTDASKLRTLPLYLKYTGFGDIQLRVEAVIGGSIVSEGGSVAHEIVRRLWLSEISEGDQDANVEKRNRLTKYSQNMLGRLATKCKLFSTKANYPLGNLTKKLSKKSGDGS